MVARDVAVVGVDDGSGNPAERVPDRVAAAVLVRGAFDLEGGGGGPEEEVRREWARAQAFGQAGRGLSDVGGHGVSP